MRTPVKSAREMKNYSTVEMVTTVSKRISRRITSHLPITGVTLAVFVSAVIPPAARAAPDIDTTWSQGRMTIAASEGMERRQDRRTDRRDDRGDRRDTRRDCRDDGGLAGKDKRD